MIISIGGNIGCGKSTLIQNLALHRPTYPEPLGKWGEWLTRFYGDPKKYGFAFQMKILLHFLDVKDNAVAERSPLDALHVFARHLLQTDTLSQEEYGLLEEYVHKIGWRPDVYIYLRTDPEVCAQRMRTRARECEGEVTFDYINKIHENYETYVGQLTDVTVHVIDANRDATKVLEAVKNILYMYEY